MAFTKSFIALSRTVWILEASDPSTPDVKNVVICGVQALEVVGYEILHSAASEPTPALCMSSGLAAGVQVNFMKSERPAL